MVELALLVAGVIVTGLVAEYSGQSRGLWVVIALVLCVASMFVLLPFLRVFIALVVTGIAMLVTSLLGRPRRAGVTR